HVEVILQVRAHTGQVMHHRDAMSNQFRKGADSGEFQQLRCIESTGGKNDFAPSRNYLFRAIDNDLDAHGLPLREEHTLNQASSLNEEVRSCEDWLDERDKCRLTLPVADGVLQETHAIVKRAVEVFRSSDACMHSRFD